MRTGLGPTGAAVTGTTMAYALAVVSIAAAPAGIITLACLISAAGQRYDAARTARKLTQEQPP